MTQADRIKESNNKISKIAIYCRVSTNEQNTTNQKLTLVKLAEEKGWIYDVFEETESTRKTRPVKQRLLHALRNKEYDGILVYKLDRYARSFAELVLEIKELVERGIAFISISDNLDFSSAAGKLHFQILCAFAEFERELIRERTIEGLKRAKQQGKQPGRPKGSKDKTKRAKSGYILRAAKQKKQADEANGIFKDLKNYIA